MVEWSVWGLGGGGWWVGGGWGRRGGRTVGGRAVVVFNSSDFWKLNRWSQKDTQRRTHVWIHAG